MQESISKRQPIGQSKFGTPRWAVEEIRRVKKKHSNSLDLSISAYDPNRGRLSKLPDEIFELTWLTELNLSGNGLSTIPEAISQLINLTSLDLGRNHLETFWEAITQLQNLRTLHIGNNQLKTLPEVITQLQNLTSLDLSYNQLSTLPETITQLQNLTSLDLGSNQLSALPEAITQLPNLADLSLSYNQFSTLPETITQLQKLETLELSGNQLSMLPGPITQLKTLTSLDLSGNQLSTLPETIAQLKNLTSLDLGFNQLTPFPEPITQLPNLADLSLSSNGLSTIPEAITEFQNLTSLDLSRNQFSSFPEAIIQLQQLEVLKLSNNQLKIIPETITQLHSLTSLNLRYNQLKTIPETITQLQNLEKLDLIGNPLATPPIEVAAEGIEAIREYFRQLNQEGVDYLYEAKLLILGEAGAGKTTFANKILDSNYALKVEESTRGVDVLKWPFRFEEDQQVKEFKANIWDFGTQEIYHATHQFFLTKRSLYALVADTRKEDTDFDYWLNIVDSLSDGSPLLIVKNKKQDREPDFNKPELKRQFDGLKEIMMTDLATNTGLKEIREEIKFQLRKLPHIGSPLPKTWVRVREQLEKDQRPFISDREYLDICKANGFTEDKDSLQLSGYLHDIGVFLHFQDDLLLKKTVILKPKWGTDAVYKILDNQTVKRNLGRFTDSDLEGIWASPEYEAMRNELLKLMMKFKLCYEIPNGKGTYIAPQLLTKDQLNYEWNDQENLLLRYAYHKFMPKGILTQFIVQMHPYIWEHRIVWKDGVIIEKDRTLAEVIEHRGEREIHVRVAGAHKKELLTIIIDRLDEIHANFKKLKYDKLIPCSCLECKNSPEPFFHKYEQLQNLIEKRKIEVQCGRSGDMVNARGLIDDIIGWKSEKEVEELMAKKQRSTQSGFNVGDNFSGNLNYFVNSTVSDSFNKIDTSSAPEKLKETLKQLVSAVETMKKEMPEEQAKETADDLNRLIDESTKKTPNEKWYSVSINGLIAAARNLGEVGDKVIELSGKVRQILTGGLM